MDNLTKLAWEIIDEPVFLRKSRMRDIYITPPISVYRFRDFVIYVGKHNYQGSRHYVSAADFRPNRRWTKAERRTLNPSPNARVISKHNLIYFYMPTHEWALDKIVKRIRWEYGQITKEEELIRSENRL